MGRVSTFTRSRYEDKGHRGGERGHVPEGSRALGVFDRKAQEVGWFWIGTPEEYNNILKRL
jgi:hypothetical protein